MERHLGFGLVVGLCGVFSIVRDDVYGSIQPEVQAFDFNCTVYGYGVDPIIFSILRVWSDDNIVPITQSWFHGITYDLYSYRFSVGDKREETWV